MDSFEYMTSSSVTSFKLSNLQYRNKVDSDNDKKVKPIYMPDEISSKDEVRILHNFNFIKHREKMKIIREGLIK